MPCRRRGDYAIAAATANWSGGWCRCTEVMRQKPDSIAVQNAEIRGEDQIERYVENISKISYPVNLISKINNRNLIVIVRGLIVFFYFNLMFGGLLKNLVHTMFFFTISLCILAFLCFFNITFSLLGVSYLIFKNQVMVVL